MSKRNNEVKKRKPSIRYRFAILNDATHEFLFAIKGTRITAIASVVGSVLLLCLIVYCLIAYTSIKYLIPGYPSYQTQKTALENASKVDSLENRVRIISLQLTNMSRIISGEQPFPVESLISDGKLNEAENIAYREKYKADSIMREKIESVEKYSLSNPSDLKQLEGLLFFPPVKGAITEDYNPSIGHPYVDISIQNNSAIRAVLDGTVIAAFWNDKTGYNLYIQHKNDLISVYKHNTKLLVDVGDQVTAGETISLAGDAGSISTGPHLHLELWHNGKPISPTLYINF